MREYVFEVEGEVVGKGRPRFTQAGRVYTPMRTRLYEKQIRRAFIERGGKMLDGPVHIDIEVIAGIQHSASKAAKKMRLAGQELSIRKPDIDNVQKIVQDALVGLAFQDDVNVLSVRMIKGRYEEAPRLIVRVRETDSAEIARKHQWMWIND
jgi:Holliday junction resolvase RusA-like endonuclease